MSTVLQTLCFALWKLVTTVRSYMAVTEKYLTFIILWIYSQQGALSCFMRVILQLSQCLALVYTEFLSIYFVSRYVTHVKADILISGSSTFEWRVNLEMYTMQIFVFFFFFLTFDDFNPVTGTISTWLYVHWIWSVWLIDLIN